MGIQIALCWSPETEEELKKMGFEKREIYCKPAPYSPEGTKGEIFLGDSEFFKMRHPPFQFVTTSWWGAAGPD